MTSIVHISINTSASPRGEPILVHRGMPLVTGQTLTSSASNQQGSQVVPAGYGSGLAVFRITVGSVGDKDIYVAFGSNPDATSAANRFLCPRGGVYEFATEAEGDKAAIVEA